MVESEAKELSEEQMLGAVTAGLESVPAVIKGIIDLAEMCAKDAVADHRDASSIKKLTADIKAKYEKEVRDAYASR
jgi:polyribonucleotide nucleotidyltransferase